jgi:Acetyltransferase (GNAT) domain
MLDIRTETLKEASAFAQYWDEIAALRRNLQLEHDVLLNPLHFLTSTDGTRRSSSIAIWKNEQLIGVMYATQHYLKGIPTGYAIGGDFSGRGLLLCAPHDENLVLSECTQRMMTDGVHSLHLRFLPRNESRFNLNGMTMKFLDAVIPGDLLQLEPTFEEFLAKLGKHTRRNIRAFTRKTEGLGIEFVPSLTRKQYEDAIERLNSKTDFPAGRSHLARDERILELHGEERLGLRGPDGKLLAVLCGFRLGERFHLLTQLNDAGHERLSLSLVLRGYLTRHLIETGLTQLHFMGGSSLSFGRYCQPEAYRSIFIDRENGIAATAKRLCTTVAKLITRLGKPVPELLATMCSGHLDEFSLSERTALRPAAMLFSQRQAH